MARLAVVPPVTWFTPLLRRTVAAEIAARGVADPREYVFAQPLLRGTVWARPNRFRMDVAIEGLPGVHGCYCPATTRIGAIRFRNVPCLVSRATEHSEPRRNQRVSSFTVEAISLDEQPTPADGPGHECSWISINQGATNRYVEFFLRSGALSELVPGRGATKNVRREQRLGSDRIDFCVEDSVYIEVKTFLAQLPDMEQHSQFNAKMSKRRFTAFERLLGQLRSLGAARELGQRAALLLCFGYDAASYNLLARMPTAHGHDDGVVQAVEAAAARGVEFWQANMDIRAHGVRLRKLVRLLDAPAAAAAAAAPGP